MTQIDPQVLFNDLPKDIKNIVDDYSSSYDHYLLTNEIIKEYHKKVKNYISDSGTGYIKFDGDLYNYRDIGLRDNSWNNWRDNTVVIYNRLYEEPVGTLPKNYL